MAAVAKQNNVRPNNVNANTRPNHPAASPNAKNVLPTQVVKLRKIGADETFSAGSKLLEPGRWEVRFAVRPDEKTDDRFEVVTVMDFRSTNAAETQQLALRACVIEQQRKYRTAFKSNPATANNAAQWSRVDVKADIVDAARKSADPVAKAKSAILKAGFTKAELLALIAAMPE